MSDLWFLVGAACACLAFAGGMGAIIFFIFRAAGRESAEMNSAWSELARRRGLACEARPPRIVGVVSGVPIRVGIVLGGPSGHMRASTLVRAGVDPTSPEPEWLRVEHRTPASVLRGAPLDTGDASFDQRFVTHTADPARARALLDESVRGQLGAIGREVTLACTASVASLSWAGQERDPATLERALDAVVAIHAR